MIGADVGDICRMIGGRVCVYVVGESVLRVQKLLLRGYLGCHKLSPSKNSIKF